MINFDLIEGLRIALAKGYTLEQAMMSFYNAGYAKEEIEEAARVLLYHPSQVMAHPEKPVSEEMKKPVKALPSTKALGEPSKESVKTKGVSAYEEDKTKTKATISILLIVLFILLVLLGGIIIFKEELINFFANLF